MTTISTTLADVEKDLAFVAEEVPALQPHVDAIVAMLKLFKKASCDLVIGDPKTGEDLFEIVIPKV